MLETVETIPLRDGKLHHFLVHKFRLGGMNERVLVGGSAIDIKERREAEQALQLNEERLREAQRVARIGSWERDTLTGELFWSEEMFHLLDLAPEQGEPDYVATLALFHPDDAVVLDACVQEAITEGKDYKLDLRQAAKEGQLTRWYHAVGKVVRDGDGQVVQLVGTLTDITAQKQLNTQLQQNLVLVQEQNVELEMQRQELASANAHLEALATTDGLTGAKNHRAFQEKLSEEFNRFERTHRPFSVIMVDVDKFKQYNDSFGHPEGDRVLVQIVQVLQEVARETDFVARYGGEEFILLLLETDVERAMQAAERFRAAMEAQEWPSCPVTDSFGVATLNATIETGPQLVEMADRALYASKEAGRNCVTHADALLVSSLAD
jgi:diguanylate cyclase (GGDEF)-like protein